MKRELKLLMLEVEKKVGKQISAASDFERLARIFSLHHVNIKSTALKKVWNFVTATEKPTAEMLDKLALFVGFQSWKDFQQALRGTNSAELNYEEEEEDEIKTTELKDETAR